MKIYKLSPDTSYRFLYPEKSIYESPDWQFNGQPLLGLLPRFNAYFDSAERAPIPDIAYLGMMTFAFTEEAAEELVEILESAGEVLPFHVDGELWYYLNVLEKLDALDEEKSQYEIEDGDLKLNLIKHFFNIEKFSSSSLFKIPNDNYTHIYCVDRRDSDKQVLANFFCAVAAHKFTGLVFEEVFSTE